MVRFITIVFSFAILLLFVILCIFIYDPILLQGVSTLLLVGVTLLYTFIAARSLRTIWDLEEKRREQKKEDLRNLIEAELEDIMGYTNNIKEQIEHFNSNYRFVKPIPCEFRALNSIINNLGILTKFEIMAILRLYRMIDMMKINYENLVKNQKSVSHNDKKEWTEFLMNSKNNIDVLWGILSDYFKNKSHDRFRERYNDFLKSLDLSVSHT